jgi:hypothetical protein
MGSVELGESRLQHHGCGQHSVDADVDWAGLVYDGNFLKFSSVSQFGDVFFGQSARTCILLWRTCASQIRAHDYNAGFCIPPNPILRDISFNPSLKLDESVSILSTHFCHSTIQSI